jgi:hypothetical protein
LLGVAELTPERLGAVIVVAGGMTLGVRAGRGRRSAVPVAAPSQSAA